MKLRIVWAGANRINWIVLQKDIILKREERKRAIGHRMPLVCYKCSDKRCVNEIEQMSVFGTACFSFDMYKWRPKVITN